MGVPVQPFSFTQCSNKVTTADASGLTGEISQLQEFIRAYVKPNQIIAEDNYNGILKQVYHFLELLPEASKVFILHPEIPR